MPSTTTRGASIWLALEPLLERVGKPIQYVGGELNSTTKDWNCGGFGPAGTELTTRWALMYPDAYEVGVPNQGVMILYEVLNERPDALAERTYAVWPDLAGLMREHSVPQFTVDAHRAALDLAGVPLHAVDRDESHPVVVAGGHAAFNPEPVADFVDCAVLGDGEQVVGDITDVVAAWKNQGKPGGRVELLARLARVEGVYVPRFYAVTYGADGAIAEIVPLRDDVPTRIAKRTVMDLDEWPYPKTPI